MQTDCLCSSLKGSAATWHRALGQPTSAMPYLWGLKIVSISCKLSNAPESKIYLVPRVSLFCSTKATQTIHSAMYSETFKTSCLPVSPDSQMPVLSDYPVLATVRRYALSVPPQLVWPAFHTRPPSFIADPNTPRESTDSTVIFRKCHLLQG